MTVRLTTLGTPRVLLEEKEVPSLPGKPVTFGLLVFLALERATTRDRLVTVFWPESSQEKARHALSQTLYELRQALGEGWLESKGNQLEVGDALWVDCLSFVEKAEDGLHADAIRLYDGPFLEGVHLAQTHSFQEWVERHRARFGRRYRATVDSFIQHCRVNGDLDSALKNAWKWVGLDPLDDGGQQHLIQLLADAGSRNEALAQFDRYAALLDSELGLEPLDEMMDLVTSIRDGSFRGGLANNTVPTDSQTGTGSEIMSAEASVTESVAKGLSPWPPPLPAETEPGPVLNRPEARHQLQDRMGAEPSLDFEVLRSLGQGSMAEVFLAREPHLKRLVAVKVLSPSLYSDARARKRFEREAQNAARINHPHVCTVFRVGVLSDGTPFYTSPFVKGTTLAQRLKAEGRLNPQEVRRVLREIASALAAAHRLGIIHRDVRPDNVLRADEGGRHSLCDFGISGVLESGEDREPKLTKTGEILGHPAYISPEQMDGQILTDRADIYSLGILGHQLLTGHPPPPSDPASPRSGPMDTSVGLEPLADYLRDTDPELVELIEHCLATDPAHRPSAADVEKKLAVDRRQPTMGGGEKLTDISVPKLILHKRLPQIIGAYAAGGWIAVEASQLLRSESFVTDRVFWLVVTTILAGFPAISVLGWFHGEKGRQDMPAVEKWLLGGVAVGWVLALTWVVASVGP